METEQRATGSLLWLWVFLGSSSFGLFAGAVGALLTMPEQQPAEQPLQVVEKPKPTPTPPKVNPAPPVVTPPVVTLPVVTPPVVTPPVKPPVVTPPVVTPPVKPPVVTPPVVKPPITPEERNVAAATEFPDLKFYLACDAFANGKTIESVSGKPVGQIIRTRLVDGVRGKAFRMIAPGGDGDIEYALDFSAQKEIFRIPEGGDFTLSLWVRFPDPKREPQTIFAGRLSDSRRRVHSFEVTNQKGSLRTSLAEPIETGNGWASVDQHLKRPVDDPGGWIHLAVVRSSNQVVSYLNGVALPGREENFKPELKYESLGLIYAGRNQETADVDEFCLFDRALRQEELARLGGRVKPSITPKPSGNPPKSDPATSNFAAGASTPLDPSTLKGLKFYLGCETFGDGTLAEGVSGKQVGKCIGVELVEGVRGKGVRLTHNRTDSHRYALDLTDQVGALTVPAETPFTMSFWARRVLAEKQSGFGAYLFDANVRQTTKHARWFSTQLFPGTPSGVSSNLGDMPNRGNQASANTARPMQSVPDPSKWNHFALVRNDKGEVRWLVNGAESAQGRSGSFPFELRYETFGIFKSSEGKMVIDFDEFCLFHRNLTEDEIKQLAGRAK